MQRYRAVQVGLGPRGMIHLEGFAQNRDRFEIVGVCDRHQERLDAAAKVYGISGDCLFRDAEEMMGRLTPDILCFSTLPQIRAELVELAVRYKVKGLMLEKPMATSVTEARAITGLCNRNGIKAVVCHQHKYLPSFMKLRDFIESGELGTVYRIDAQCQSWLAHIAMHYMDYIIWANGGIGPVSAVGHIHGKSLLHDSHPSPDYIIGELVMANGVRAGLQCGYYTRPKLVHEEDYTDRRTFKPEFWADCRLTVYGETGYAWAECNGRWAAFTAKTNGVQSGSAASFASEQAGAQARYTHDFACWLDDDSSPHPSNINQAYNGFEAIEAICLSALDHTRIDFPIQSPSKIPVLSRMESELPAVERRIFR